MVYITQPSSLTATATMQDTQLFLLLRQASQTAHSSNGN